MNCNSDGVFWVKLPMAEVWWRLGVAPGGLPAAGGSACDPRGRDAGVRGHSQGAPWENHGKTMGKTMGKPEMPAKSTKYVRVFGCGLGLLVFGGVLGLLSKVFWRNRSNSNHRLLWQLVWGPNFTISAGSTHVSSRLSAKGSYSHTIGDQCNLSHVPAKVSKWSVGKWMMKMSTKLLQQWSRFELLKVRLIFGRSIIKYR